MPIRKLRSALRWFKPRNGLLILLSYPLILTGLQAKAQVAFPNYALMLGSGAAAVFAATKIDDSAQGFFNGKGRIGEFRWVGNKVVGKGVPGLILGAGFWAGGHLFESEYEIHSGRAQVETLLVTGVIVTTIKSLANRRRPNGEDSYSFPSAHSAYAFASASVLNEFYGWKVGLPAYILAGLTATARMEDNQHWFSDTVAGAAISVIIGTTISRWHLRTLDDKKSEFVPEIMPKVAQGELGLSLTWEY